MLNAMAGWYVGQAFGANFDTIQFEVSVAAGSTSAPTKLSKAVADSIDGSDKQKRLTGGENFFATSVYSLCEPGKVRADILPNNNSNNKLSILIFKPRTMDIGIPKLFETDVSIDFYNSENQSNDVTLSFEGFWIPENQTPVFTDTTMTPLRILNDLDLQVLSSNKLLTSIAKLLNISNSLLVNPKSYTVETLASASPIIPILVPTEEKVKIKRVCGTGKAPEKEDEEEDN